MDRKPTPQQTIRVFGQAEQQAYERTVAMREVTFTCIVCHQRTTQLRYPGPLPRYCSEACRAVQAQLLNQQRVRKQREKRQAARAARGKASIAAGSSQIGKPSAPAALPLLASKLSPPRLPALLLERSHVLARLDTALLHTLTLLQAPAGFGKTTVVNQWIARNDERRTMNDEGETHRSSFIAHRFDVAWVSLDAGDNDLLRFWRYVLMACQALLGQGQEQKHSGPGQAALALLSSAGHSPFAPPPMEQVLTLLLNDLAQLQQAGLLVLDDYHAITEPRIHETLAFFIDHLPAPVHVLLLSRSSPPLPLLRWRARGALYELHPTDLRFSPEETAAFLRQALPAPLSDAALTQLDTTLEGWAAGLRLLALTLQGQPTARAVEQALLSLGQRSGSSAPQRALLDYFVTEILDAQPEPMQRFLLQTSVLSRLNGPLCDAVTGSANSAAQLEAIERAGLFLEALDGTGSWYRYHALFAEAMRREASRRLGEAVLQALSLRASLWYEQQALLTDALEAALLAHDAARVALLVEQVDAQGYFYELQTMLRWLAPLPETVLRAHPMLCFIFAVALRFSQETLPIPAAVSERIEALLQMAEEGWRRQEQWPWIGAIWAFRALSATEQEPFSRTVAYARQALSLLPQDDLDSRMQVWHGTCLLLVGMEKLREGHLGEARQLFLDAQARSQAGSNGYLTRTIRLLVGSVHLIEGELDQARQVYRQVLADAREQEEHETIADALLELARLAFERNDLARAEQQAREALELAGLARHQRQELRDRAVFQLALVDHVQGQTSAAQQQLAALLARLQERSTPDALLLVPLALEWQGRLLLATGDLQAAQHSLETQARNPQARSFAQQLGTQMLQGRLLLAQGKAQEALLHLERLLLVAQEHQHQYSALEIQVLLALAYAACNHEYEAQHWLRQTLSQAHSAGFLRLFLNEGAPLARLLRSLLPTIQDKALRSYAQAILRAFAMAPGDGRDAAPASSYGLLLELLSPQEQRVLRLLAAGWTNREIARELVVSANTVKDHVKNLYRKLGVSNRVQASEAVRHLKLDQPA